MDVGADREVAPTTPGTSRRGPARAARSPRGSCAARRCRRARRPAAARGRCGRSRRRGRPTIGMTSAVVLPTSMSSASGCASATASAVATQLAAATSHGRARAASTDTSSPAVVSTLSGRPSASCAASSTNATPSRLVAERVGELGGHGDRDGVRRDRRDLGGDLAQHGGQRLAVAPDLERARDRAQRRRRRARRPWCSRRRCPLLAWPPPCLACASSVSSISRTARRSTPCAASANAIARLRSVIGGERRRRARPGARVPRRARARRAVRRRPRRDRRAAAARTRAHRCARWRARRASMVDAGVSEPARGAGAARPRRAPRDRRDRDAARPRGARPAARRASRRRGDPQRRPARRRLLSPDARARRACPRSTPCARLHRAGLARRSCSTWPAWAAAPGRTSR